MSENKPNLIKSIGLLTVLMMISKVLGLIREVTIASFYGVSSSTDAYFIAGGFVTNVFFGITVALSTVFLPYYIDIKKRKSREEVYRECSSLITSLGIFAIILIAVLYVLAPWLIQLIAPEYVGDIFNEAVLYLRIYSVTILFSLFTNMFTSLLNAESRYGFGALASVVYSFTSIVCMIVLKKWIGVTALAISVPLSFFIQLIILTVNVRKYIKIRPVFTLFNPVVKRLLWMMLPVLLSNATIEINQLLTRSLAAGLDEGAVSILSYSNTLFNFVSTLITTTFTTIFFTELSNAARDSARKRYNDLISKALNILIVVLLPIATITSIFSVDIVKIAYGRGAFSQESVTVTASCLSIYAFAFVFDAIRNLLIKAYYAKNNTRTPLINSCISLVITVGLSYLLTKQFGVNGIIVAITISILVSALFLTISAKREICEYNARAIISTAWKAVVSISFTTVVLVALNIFSSDISSYLRFGLAIFVGFGVYFFILLLLKCDEGKVLLSMIMKKVRHKT